jgi:hypothetical protein
VKLVLTFATWSAWRIPTYLWLSRSKPLLFLPSSSSTVLTRLTGPVPDPLLLGKSGSAGNQILTSGSVARNSAHYTTDAVRHWLLLTSVNYIPLRWKRWSGAEGRVCIVSHRKGRLQRLLVASGACLPSRYLAMTGDTQTDPRTISFDMKRTAQKRPRPTILLSLPVYSFFQISQWGSYAHPSVSP